jgi:aldose 1-epimerase
MNIRRRPLGTTRGHAAEAPTSVEAFTLDTRDLSVTVWTYGATLVEVSAQDRRRAPVNVVTRLADLAAYEDRACNPYVGAVLGRYARCIANGRFVLDGVEYQLDRNMGPHHFHGGTIGFDRFVWAAEAERRSDRLELQLRIQRPDEDQGYPGQLSAEVVYRLFEGAVLEIEYRATTSATTVVGLTNHAYWNLSGRGTIDDQRLAINASKVVVVDSAHIPCGSLASVVETPLDFRRPRSIGKTLLDCCFLLDHAEWAAVLSDPGTGRRLQLRTDQPGLAVYSGEKAAPSRGGLCLQTGGLPDAPNRPDFPSSRLDPGQAYRHRSTYELFPM